MTTHNTTNPDDGLFVCTHCGQRVTLDVMREHEDLGKSTAWLDDWVALRERMAEQGHEEGDV